MPVSSPGNYEDTVRAGPCCVATVGSKRRCGDHACEELLRTTTHTLLCTDGAARAHATNPEPLAQLLLDRAKPPLQKEAKVADEEC